MFIASGYICTHEDRQTTRQILTYFWLKIGVRVAKENIYCNSNHDMSKYRLPYIIIAESNVVAVNSVI